MKNRLILPSLALSAFFLLASCGHTPRPATPPSDANTSAQAVAEQNLPSLVTNYDLPERNAVIWDSVLHVVFPSEIDPQAFNAYASVVRFETDAAGNAGKPQPVDVQVSVVSGTEIAVQGKGETYVWDPGYSYQLVIKGDFWGSKKPEFRQTFLEPSRTEFYLSDLQWSVNYNLVDGKLVTDEYDLTFTEQFSPSIFADAFRIEPEPENAQIELSYSGIIVRGNFSPKEKYRLYIEDLMDVYGRHFHFPFVELPQGVSDNDPPQTQLLTLDSPRTFFYTENEPPKYVIRRGKGSPETASVTLCRIPLNRESIFHRSPLISPFIDSAEYTWWSQDQKDIVMKERHWKKEMQSADCEEQVTRTVSFAQQKIVLLDLADDMAKLQKPFGIFAFFINDDQTINQTSRFFGIVNTSLLWKQGQRQGMVWAFDLDGVSPVAGAPVTVKPFTLYDETRANLPKNPVQLFGTLGSASIGKTDEKGVLRFDLPADFGMASQGAILSTPTHFGVVFQQWREGLNSYNFPVTWNNGYGLDESLAPEEMEKADRTILGHAYTEKLLYRPGQTVHWKALFRERAKDTLELEYPSQFSSVNVRVVDARGEEMLNEQDDLNAYGGVAGTFTLPAGAPLGSYMLIYTPLTDTGTQVDQSYWSYDRKTISTQIDVQEYALPTFKVDALLAKHDFFREEDIVVQVRAAEYSGSPLAKGKLHYRFIARPYYPEDTQDTGYTYGQALDRFREEYRNFTIDEKDVTLDENGSAEVRFPSTTDALSLENDYSLSFEYTVEDDQGRQVGDTASLRWLRMLSPEDYVGGIRIAKQSYRAGESVAIDYVSKDYRLERVPSKTLTLRILKNVQRCVQEDAFLKGAVNRCEVTQEEVTQEEVTTDADGYGSFAKSFPQAGQYIVELVHGDLSVQRSLWITSASMPPAIDTMEDRYLTIALDKESYTPGEQATVVVHSPYPRTLLLLSFEANDVIRTEVIAMETPLLEYSFPVAQEFLPNVYINGIAIERSHGNRIPEFKFGYVNLSVDISSKSLAVSVVSDRESYGPGDTVQLTVETKDSTGRGVAAELSVAAVDEAIIRLGGQVDTRFLRAFYSRRLLFVENALTLVALHDDYYFATYGGAGKGGLSYDVPPIRKKFDEVAFFDPFVRTDASGKATVTFTLPDTLTSYTILTAGSSLQGQLMGSNESSISVRMDYYLQPILPRFFRKADEVSIVARVYNMTENAASIGVRLEGDGFILLDTSEEVKGEIPSHAFRDFPYRVRIPDDASDARFVFKTIGSAGTDAIELKRPIAGYSLFSAVHDSMVLSGDSTKKFLIRLPKYIDPAQGALTISVGSSVFTALQANLRKLIEYPYGCAEQTISTTVPNAVYLGAVRSLGLPEDERAQANLREGFVRLGDYQQRSGGFSLWAGGEVDPGVSLIVGRGFVDIEAAGFRIPEPMRENLVTYLTGVVEELRAQGGSYDERQMLDLVFVLTSLAPKQDHTRLIENSFYKLPALTTGEKYMLARTYLLRKDLVTGKEKEYLTMKLDVIEQDLWRTLVETGTGTYAIVQGPDAWSMFASSDASTLAEAFRVLVALRPSDVRIPAILRQVATPSGYAGYFSSYDEQQRFLAMAEYMRAAGKNTEKTAVTLKIAGQEYALTVEDLQPSVLTFPLADVLQDAHLIPMEGVVGTSGKMAFVSYDISYAVKDITAMVPVENGVRVERKIANERGDVIGDLAGAEVGDTFRITLTVENIRGTDNLAVTDFLPAGLEFIDPPKDASGFDHLDFRDDRLDAFPGNGAQTSAVTYTVRVLSEGSFHWPPATAVAMYESTVEGASQGSMVTIAP